jgi:hypothetical protein
MHDEQLGWEEIQAEYDALSEREKQRYIQMTEVQQQAWQARLDPCCHCWAAEASYVDAIEWATELHCACTRRLECAMELCVCM